MNGYTRAEAVALCSRVREQSRAVVSTPDRMRCWQCLRQSGGDPDLMYMARKPGYLGCDLMNRLRTRTERARSV
jgi:hypothetical protein